MHSPAPRPEVWTDLDRILEPPAGDRRDYGAAIARLVGLMAKLRGPGGCPWDREQTLASLKQYLVEETYEVLDAIDESPQAHREELGDLLLQIVFQCELRREQDAFDLCDVTHEIADKLVRRHSHVFGPEQAADAKEALNNWERQKSVEKAGRSAVDGVPRALPALLRGQRVSEKAGRVGFDWTDLHGPQDKLVEECEELREAIAAGEPGAISEELGDVLFTLCNLARHLGVVAEDALQGATNRFIARFQHMESAADGPLHGLDIFALESLWRSAKATAGKETR